MRKLTVALIMAAGLVAAQPANADPIAIVDTGPGDDISPWFLGPTPTDGVQWLAAQFSVNRTWMITSVQGYIEPTNTGLVRFRLYDDLGDMPDVVASPRFDESLSITSGAPNWYGPSGWSVLIGPGNYWLAFELPDGSEFKGNMPSPSPHPLGNEAFRNDTTFGTYFSYPPLDIGVQVYANAVPDTTRTALLFLLGVGVIGAATRLGRRPTA